MLINFCNSNSEFEQLSTFSSLQKLLVKSDDYSKKSIVFRGDFNLIFDQKFDASGGNPILKKKSLAKLIEIKETLFLCDIWRIRNPNVRRFTFRQNHVSGFIDRRLDFFLISNILQESVIKTDVLASFCTDHSPIFFSIKLKDMPTRGQGFWKFNNSLTSNSEYVEKMKNQILETLRMLNQDKITDKHLRWEFLKYEIRKFTMNFSKNLVKKENKDRNFLEKELNRLEKNLTNFQTNQYYLECKQKLQNIYTKKANGIRIRSKCNWYENGEKSTKFFLNHEKYLAQPKAVFVPLYQTKRN